MSDELDYKIKLVTKNDSIKFKSLKGGPQILAELLAYLKFWANLKKHESR